MIVVASAAVVAAATACSNGDDAASTTPSATAGAPTSGVPVTDLAGTEAAATDTVESTQPPVEPTTPPVETTVPATTDAPAPGGFAVPTAQIDGLEAAGLGALVDIDYPAQPAGVPWPTGSWTPGPLPAGVDAAAVQAILDEAFTPIPDAGGTDTGKIDAVLAVQGGRLVVEAYNGWDPSAPHSSWSMAKSVTGAMLGILVAEGRLDPFAPAPVPEWADPADPRHAITIAELMQMRSGLQWNEDYGSFSDVLELFGNAGQADRGGFAANKELAAAPDTVFNYSTGTAMLLARIVADQVGHGEAGTTWAQQALFGPLGITTVSHDLDGSGVMSGGSRIDMSPQDFARFGLLYLRGGAWEDGQLVPQEWVDFARLPRDDNLEYGALWWTSPELTPYRFRADGFAGQLIVVVPELDLVVVSLAAEQLGRSDETVDRLIQEFAAAA